MNPEIRSVNAIVGVWAKNPQLACLIPAILVHKHINIKVERSDDVTDYGQNNKVFKNLIQKHGVKGFNNVLSNQWI